MQKQAFWRGIKEMEMKKGSGEKWYRLWSGEGVGDILVPQAAIKARKGPALWNPMQKFHLLKHNSFKPLLKGLSKKLKGKKKTDIFQKGRKLPPLFSSHYATILSVFGY